MNENWITEAFEKAQAEAYDARPVARVITEFLETQTPHIIDAWVDMVGKESILKLAVLFQKDDALQTDIVELCRCFCVAGFLYHQYLEDQK